MTHLEKITERVCRNGHPDSADTPRPLITVSEFFEGNDVVGSIGCNLSGAPYPSEFYDLLIKLSIRSDVKDIRIQITAFDDPGWPFSDTIYFFTSASESEVESWFPPKLAPDEVWTGFVDQPYEAYEVPVGTQPIACWWD